MQKAFRNRGIGKELMKTAEEWARAHGCLEMASDTWIDNEESQHAHEALGFEVVDRCVNLESCRVRSGASACRRSITRSL